MACNIAQRRCFSYLQLGAAETVEEQEHEQRHQECRIGGAYMMHGEKTSTLAITPDLFRNWEDRPETVAKIDAVGEKLRRALEEE